MKIKMLQDGDAVATIESALTPRRDHGVVCEGPKAVDAGDAVNACRAALQLELGRRPTSEEIVAKLATDTTKFEIAD